jgi:GTP cyclohydrolase II
VSARALRPKAARRVRSPVPQDRHLALAFLEPLTVELPLVLRNYGIGAQILRDLNVGRMRLLARPRKMPSMAGFDLEVTGYESEPSPRSSQQA